MLVVCERWVGDGDRLIHNDPKFFFLLLARVAQPWDTEGLKPSVCRWVSIRHLVPNWLQLQLELELTKPSVAPGYIIVWLPPASAVLRFFTQVYLLIDGSVEGQYVTFSCSLSVLFVSNGWLMRWAISDLTATVSWNISSMKCPRHSTAFLLNCHLAFSLYILLAFMWCIHIVVMTQL